jgi:toxin ParE1/3/4
MPKGDPDVSHAATPDLASIFRPTRARWNQEQAVRYVDTADAGFNRIASKPDLGRDRSDQAAGTRSRVVGRHVVFYRVEPHRIVILRVLHPAQAR